MERAKQDAGLPSLIDALDPAIERDHFDIQIGELLQVPAPLVARLPLHWIGSALTLLDSRALINKPKRKGSS